MTLLHEWRVIIDKILYLAAQKAMQNVQERRFAATIRAHNSDDGHFPRLDGLRLEDAEEALKVRHLQHSLRRNTPNLHQAVK